MRIALTIAGSDSIAGAGVQADLKTFAALGVYGVSALTAITAQNTTAVGEVVALSPRLVQSQIELIAQDVEISATKTGMLATGEITEVVAETIRRLQFANVVVDPVMTATTAASRTLLAPEAVSVMKARLLPITTVVTPNAAEAAVLAGVAVDSLNTVKEAAKRIADLGPAAVVVKGGHLAGADAVDVLFHAGTFTEFVAPRSPVGVVHGTGCTFASAIAAGLALGDDIPAAVQRAKTYVTRTIERSLKIGHGSRVPDHGLYFPR
jgi:hydroxymethylpyrimidine/phosphomethylpyrimidine kinase